jgi:hypothetical protein
MNSRIVLGSICISVLFLAGCDLFEKDIAGQAFEGAIQAPPTSQAPQLHQACTTSAECGEMSCIDGICAMLSEVFSGACAQTCTVREMTLTTSDGETLTALPGKGGYTGAGAIEWFIESGPLQCSSDPLVPVHIVKRNFGKVVSEEHITLAKGSTSRAINHPTILSLAFTLRLDDVKCS